MAKRRKLEEHFGSPQTNDSAYANLAERAGLSVAEVRSLAASDQLSEAVKLAQARAYKYRSRHGQSEQRRRIMATLALKTPPPV